MERNDLHKEGEYYVVLCGDLNVPSPYTGRIYERNENFHREIARLNKMRAVYCTLGGPKLNRDGHNDKDVMQEFQSISNDDICGLLRNIHFRYEDDKALLVGNLRFAGPKGQIAKEMFEQQPSAARMAMRSTISYLGSRARCQVENIITFDVVSA
jgi:hypothetical protein